MTQETAVRHKRGGIYFEDFEVGSLTEHRCTRTVTQMDNMLFSNMTLNPQPLHIDRHFCEKETEWGQPLMNSLFTLGLMIGIPVNDMTVGTTIANLGMTDVKFPPSAVRGRHRALHDRGPRQARVEVAPRRRHRRVPPPRLQPGRQAGRRMPPPGLHAACGRNNADALPSFRSRRQRARSSTRRMTSGADAVIVDLEDSIAPKRKAAARATARPLSCKEAVTQATRPRLLVRVNGLATGLIDDDLDAVVPAQARRHPAAEGGRRRRGHPSSTPSSPRARRSPACPTAHIKIVAHRDRDRAGAVPRRHLSRRERAAHRPDLGRGGSCPPSSAPKPTATREGRLRSIPIGSRARSASPARRRARCRRSTPSTSISATSEGLRRECEEARRDGFTGKMAIHPAQVAVINEVFTPTRRGDREGAAQSSRRSPQALAPASSASTA